MLWEVALPGPWTAEIKWSQTLSGSGVGNPQQSSPRLAYRFLLFFLNTDL